MLNDAGGSAQGDTKAPAPIVQASKKPVWHEVKSDDGNYFWNIENNGGLNNRITILAIIILNFLKLYWYEMSY